MPRTPMSDAPLSPVNEYYKVLNKRIMEEKIEEEKILIKKGDRIECKTSINLGGKEGEIFTQNEFYNCPEDNCLFDNNGNPKIIEPDSIENFYTTTERANLRNALKVISKLSNENFELQLTIDRYEKALREICNPKYSQYDCYDIADEALKALNPPSDEK